MDKQRGRPDFFLHSEENSRVIRGSKPSSPKQIKTNASIGPERDSVKMFRDSYRPEPRDPHRDNSPFKEDASKPGINNQASLFVTTPTTTSTVGDSKLEVSQVGSEMLRQQRDNRQTFIAHNLGINMSPEKFYTSPTQNFRGSAPGDYAGQTLKKSLDNQRGFNLNVQRTSPANPVSYFNPNSQIKAQHPQQKSPGSNNFMQSLGPPQNPNNPNPTSQYGNSPGLANSREPPSLIPQNFHQQLLNSGQNFNKRQDFANFYINNSCQKPKVGPKNQAEAGYTNKSVNIRRSVDNLRENGQDFDAQ